MGKSWKAELGITDRDSPSHPQDDSDELKPRKSRKAGDIEGSYYRKWL